MLPGPHLRGPANMGRASRQDHVAQVAVQQLALLKQHEMS